MFEGEGGREGGVVQITGGAVQPTPACCRVFGIYGSEIDNLREPHTASYEIRIPLTPSPAHRPPIKTKEIRFFLHERHTLQLALLSPSIHRRAVLWLFYAAAMLFFLGRIYRDNKVFSFFIYIYIYKCIIIGRQNTNL